MELKTGILLQGGKYKIVNKLGQGSFGITYLAEGVFKCDNGVDEVSTFVAIKEFYMRDLNTRAQDGLTIDGRTSQTFIDYHNKFRKEAANLSRISHPNIVKVVDVFSENGTSYMVMSNLGSQNLNKLIGGNGLPEQICIKYALQICEALKCMHDANMLHLDLKPDNVMIVKEQAVLIDFGLSKHYDSDGNPDSTTSIGLGTPGYAPLEQSNYDKIDKKVGLQYSIDIYSFGATLFKMLTGKTPPIASTILNQGFPEDELKSTGCSKSMIRFVKKCMAPLTKHRYQNIDSCIRDLNSIAKGEQIDSSSEDESTQFGDRKDSGKKHTKKGKSRKFVLWLGIGFIIMLIATACLYQVNGCFGLIPKGKPVAVTDSVVVVEDSVPMLEIHDKNFSYGDSKLAIQYPVNGNSNLIVNIREWINENLEGTYKGSLEDENAFFKHYSDKLSKEYSQDQLVQQIDIRKVYEDSKIVTYSINSEAYFTDAAHGSGRTNGVTFRKSDGRRFTKDLIQKYYNLKPHIAKGLRKYFNHSSDSELMEYIIGFLRSDYSEDDLSVDNIPLPSNDPWITKDGFNFSYNEYEIAPYSDGRPSFVIPTSIVKPNLMPSASSFIE